MSNQQSELVSRREFMEASAIVLCVGALGAEPSFAEQSSGIIRAGLIGCGKRGTQAAKVCMRVAKNLQLIALGDFFEERLGSTRAELSRLGARFTVRQECSFAGADAYEKVILCGIDLLIIATPAGCRTLHSDETISLSTNKRVSFVADSHRPVDRRCHEIVSRIQSDRIAQVEFGRCGRSSGVMRTSRLRRLMKQEPEFHPCSWLYFTWLPDDYVVAHHLRYLDLASWVSSGDALACL
jgi:myo-inositol 2-dehydrogenase/D-chiro-inositol 1-dehydrogenase